MPGPTAADSNPTAISAPKFSVYTSLMAVLRRLFHASLALGWTQIIGISSFKTFKKGEVWLVGGFNPSEKYESVGMIIPNIWKNMFQTTNQMIN